MKFTELVQKMFRIYILQDVLYTTVGVRGRIPRKHLQNL